MSNAETKHDSIRAGTVTAILILHKLLQHNAGFLCLYLITVTWISRP